MKIVDIKGKRSYVRFLLSDDSYIKGDGESLVNGFAVYKRTLKLIKCEGERLLTDAEKEELIESVTDFLNGAKFVVDFTD